MVYKVVLASDNNYLLFTMVTIYSLLKNLSGLEDLSIFVLHDGLLDLKLFRKYKEKIEDAVKRSVAISPISIGQKFDTSPLTINHISKATFFRLDIPHLFPNDVVLYLDSDVLVVGDISEIFDIQLGSAAIAGVYAAGYHSKAPWVKDYCERNLLPDMDTYLNAGVLLFNNPQIISCGVLDKLELLRGRRFDSQDQDILNSACYGRIKPLSYRFNVMTKYINKEDLLIKVFGEQVLNDINSPVVIHFADKQKPWIDQKLPFASLWWQYASELSLTRDLYIFKLKNLGLRWRKKVRFSL